jgi:hypothetical protein
MFRRLYSFREPRDYRIPIAIPEIFAVQKHSKWAPEMGSISFCGKRRFHPRILAYDELISHSPSCES